MPYSESEKNQLTTLFGVFFLIMMAVFAAEVTVMQAYEDLFLQWSVGVRALFDASTLVLIIAFPLWFFVLNPSFRAQQGHDGNYTRIALALYIKVLVGLFIVQLCIMLLLPGLMASLPPKFESLVDATLTVMISAPMFWWLLIRLNLHKRLEPLADFLSAPVTLYILLLFMIFLADLLQEILFPQFRLPMSEIQYQLLDALVTILLIAPMLLILVVRPLRRMAQFEKVRTNAIYDQVVDGIIKIDRNGLVESFNLAAQNIFGFAPDEIIGNPAAFLLQRCNIDLPLILEKLNHDRGTAPLEFRELPASRQDGSSLTLDMSISRVLDDPVEYLLLLRDITQRKAAEDALLATDAIFREVYDQTEDAIIFFEPGTGRILDVNATAEGLYGFSKRKLQHQGFRLFCDRDTAQRFSALLAEIVGQGSGHIDRMVNLCNGGREIVVSIRGKMMVLQNEQVVYCTIRDISERVRLEDEAREIQAKLIHTNKMTSLGLLVSGVAHEINNPNNLVLTNNQLLSRVWNDARIVLQKYYKEHGDFVLGGISFKDLDELAPELFRGISDGSQRINAIVNDLKRFVRQDPTQEAADVDVNAVVTSAVSMLHYELVQYTDNFNVELAEDLPPVKGSAQQLGQVIINLLMNACQALPDKEGGVWLETRYDAHADQVMISVRDEGCGLPPDAAEQILEPFFTTKLETGGTGLGLSISNSILKEHNGRLDFSSEPDRGTTFTVILPASSSVQYKEQTI